MKTQPRWKEEACVGHFHLHSKHSALKKDSVQLVTICAPVHAEGNSMDYLLA